MSKEELEYYYSKADRYTDEIWHYYMGPTLWSSLLEVVQLNPEDLPKVIAGVCKLDYKDLATLCNKIINDKEEAREDLFELNIL